MNDFQDELFWTAFRYACDELDEAAATQFEGRLADEQPAREALAEAVSILAAARVAEAEPIGVPADVLCEVAAENRGAAMAATVIVPASLERSFWERPLVQNPAVWFLGGVAACLALMFGLSRSNPHADGPRHAAVATSAPAAIESQRQLAMAWIASQPADELPNDGFANGEAAHDNSVDVDDFTAMEVPVLADEPAAPEWLIAALAETQSTRMPREN
jgi:hypothetical protein